MSREQYFNELCTPLQKKLQTGRSMVRSLTKMHVDENKTTQT